MAVVEAGEGMRRLGDFSLVVLRRFLDDRCLLHASALTYTSLLSIVPLLAGDGLFEGVLAALVDPLVDEHARVARIAELRDVRTGVGLADLRARRVQQALDFLRVAVDEGMRVGERAALDVVLELRRAQQVSGHRAAVDQREPDGLGLRHQIADREHQPVGPDQHAVAGALGAQVLRRERIVGHLRADQHHGIEHLLQVEAELALRGLQFGGKCPVGLVGHVCPEEVAEKRCARVHCQPVATAMIQRRTA